MGNWLALASTEWGAIIVASLSAAFAAWVKYAQWKGEHDDREEDRDTHQRVEFYSQLVNECKQLRNDNQVMRAKLSELETAVDQLRRELEFYERNHLAQEAREMIAALFDVGMPRPAWLHDLASNQWYLNEAYSRAFNVPRRSFWHGINIFGRYDVDDAIRYASHDQQVVDTGTTIEFRERMRRDILNPECEEVVVGRFRKTPIVINDRPYVFGQLLEYIGPEPEEIDAYRKRTEDED